jgi:hypothetical protein
LYLHSTPAAHTGIKVAPQVLAIIGLALFLRRSVVRRHQPPVASASNGKTFFLKDWELLARINRNKTKSVTSVWIVRSAADHAQSWPVSAVFDWYPW